MESWVRSLRSNLAKVKSTDTVTLVVGNEACDLDSGVSALTYGYHLSRQHPSLTVLPLLNIPAVDYPLRTELVHCLEQANIREEDLIFKDLLQLHLVQVRVVLVDHNVSVDYPPAVLAEVIDHHANEMDPATTSTIRCTIEPVGSCATLVAERIFAEDPDFADRTALGLLRDTIVLDTVCFSEAAKRTTAKDRTVFHTIQAKLQLSDGPGAGDLQAVYDRIWSAKVRTDHLTPHQLLRRDLKCFTASQGQVVAVSAVPMLVQAFSQLPDVQQQANLFLQDGGYTLGIVLGIQITDGCVSRDLLVLNGGEASLTAAAIKGLQECRGPDLQLVQVEGAAGSLGTYFTQGNDACSRKQILPVLKKALVS